ncbi:MAG: WG repeat-containing protein [Legionellales bacterium]|nr:WG repeat-containing protein [Legionellales bacterium]
MTLYYKKNYVIILLICLVSFCNAQSEKYTIFEDPLTKFFGIKEGGIIKIPAVFEKIYPVVPAPFSSSIKTDSLCVQTPRLLTVLKNGQWQRINKNGKFLFYPMNFDNGPDYYVQGLSRFITAENKVGFHNIEGEIIIPAEYDFAAPFGEDGHSIEPKGTKYTQVCNGCYMKRPADERLSPVSSYADNRKKVLNFKESSNYLPIQGGEWGFIDKRGKIIVPIKYSTFEEALEKLEETLN